MIYLRGARTLCMLALRTERALMETIGTCAVVGCTNRGRPQVCVFDGRYHHHGHTHYNNFGPRVGLVFRSITDGWFDMCNDHQAIIAAAMSHAPKATV